MNINNLSNIFFLIYLLNIIITNNAEEIEYTENSYAYKIIFLLVILEVLFAFFIGFICILLSCRLFIALKDSNHDESNELSISNFPKSNIKQHITSSLDNYITNKSLLLPSNSSYNNISRNNSDNMEYSSYRQHANTLVSVDSIELEFDSKKSFTSQQVIDIIYTVYIYLFM